MVADAAVISLTVPTRGRPERFAQMVTSAYDTSTGEIEIVARLDSDDAKRDRYPDGMGVVYLDGDRPEHMSSLWNECWAATDGDIVMLAADDIVFQTPGWDERVTEAFAAVPDRLVMVYADDGSTRRAPVLPFVSRRWTDLVGFTSGELPGWFADEWIWALAAEIRRVVFLEDVMIRHEQRGNDKTYREAAAKRQRLGGLNGMRRTFYSIGPVSERDRLIEKLRAGMTDQVERIPAPVPGWFTESLQRASRARPAVVHEPNRDTLVVIHCWAGDEDNVREFLPYHRRHGRPILLLSPEDAPVQLKQEGVDWHAVGKRGYFGEESLRRQRAHLEYLLSTPYHYFLLNDADSICLSPELPAYLYDPGAEYVVFSNEVPERRPHTSPYPKIAMQPPYFLTRTAIEKLLTVDVEAHPITPFIDWYMVALCCESGIGHRSFPDGASFPAWRRNVIAETKKLGHDYKHVADPRGRIRGDELMVREVRHGKVMIHSVKHKPVMDKLIETHDARSGRPSSVVVVEPSISVLVPFRPESIDDVRARAWDWIRDRWSWVLPKAEICEGHDDGMPFSKTAAVNDAFLKSSGDVLVVADADAWMEGDQLMRAVLLTMDRNRLVVPWGQVVRIDQEGSESLLGYPPRGPVPLTGLRADMTSPMPITAGTIYVLSRRGFRTVQGMDPRFRGYGYEDIAFRRSCDALLGKSFYQHMGVAYSLWHPRPVAENWGRIWEGDEGRRNGELDNQYREAERKPHLMRKLIEQHPLGQEPMPIQPRVKQVNGIRKEFMVHEKIY